MDAAGLAVRCLVRPGEKLVVRRPLARRPEVVAADLPDPASLPAALAGVDAAYSLVHSMGGRTIGEIDTRCQPIAVADVVGYLVGCLAAPATAGLSLDIGGPEVTTYRGMMRTYARVRGLHRLIIPVPVLTPRLSAHWINLVTPVPAGVVFPLVEGLKNEVICRDTRIRDLVPIALTPMEAAICTALTETLAGPGKIPSRQACFLGR